MKIIKPLFSLAIIALFIILCVQLIPPYWNNYQFSDFLDQEARQTSYTNMTEDAIRHEIYKEAQSDNIPVTEDQIQVMKNANYVSLSVDYTVHVNLPVYPQDLHFSATSKNKAI